jgi:hypothetical protein
MALLICLVLALARLANLLWNCNRRDFEARMQNAHLILKQVSAGSLTEELARIAEQLHEFRATRAWDSPSQGSDLRCLSRVLQQTLPREPRVLRR